MWSYYNDPIKVSQFTAHLNPDVHVSNLREDFAV